MNPSEAWALLTLRSKSFDRSSGAHGSLTSGDVAALLGGLDREPFLMGMAAELADMRSLREVELNLWARAGHMARKENWKLIGGEMTVRRLSAVALYEAIDDLMCYECNGTKQMVFAIAEHPGLAMARSYRAINPQSCAVECIACEGEGRIVLTGRRKAALASLNKDTWTRFWSGRYERIFEIAHGWRETAGRYLANRLKDEQVDTEGLSAQIRAYEQREENINKISDSCALPKLHGKNSPREVTSEGNSGVTEVDFRAMKRTKLRLPEAAE